jgi:hypothetical protein
MRHSRNLYLGKEAVPEQENELLTDDVGMFLD